MKRLTRNDRTGPVVSKPAIVMALAPSLAKIVRPLIARNLYILPSWCERLEVMYDPDDAKNVCTVVGRHQYREAVVRICGPFIDKRPDEQQWAIEHEFSHLPLEPLDDFIRDIIKTTSHDETVRTLALWMRLLEAATCDVQHAISLSAKGRRIPRTL